uniref:Uncharacterized protein n=1 Tax=Fibrocapsa japonica TaxID=94617 RepID=A0A7S2XVJ0_9STRA|mmetsp:Transcript_12881/g.19013  ORF Transcript_12881/g.19013 Transcript_12881/m.19013 type:complete len:234 (+) Transcript_12881:160-861(+)|eukprot:CAMPEP_0113941274 /NCGR_PEP_ID=MMETSP1339-20121228/7228_1 /TAXON_ID=94617 /ORGANISM="Fibrocapsa japonica" /LENGTH=233 /DNA_ID=CAMNT_0000945377 /DNA_START=55 /DNA_END=756 /DNA_ORIENTATION=+ /assembly_acc=CAM_ASM_000762
MNAQPDNNTGDVDGVVTLDAAVTGFKSALRSMESAHKPLLMLRCKVVLVGDACVGKSALVQMFHGGGQRYPKNYVMTTGVGFCVKQVNIPDTNCAVELYLFDCAGQSIFNQREQNLKSWENTSYVVVVYDVGNRDSFQSCAKWLQGVRSTRQSSMIPGVLVANKSDLREGGINSRAAVSDEEGRNFAQENSLEFFETSAAEAKNVDAPFNFIASQFHQKYEQTVQRAEALSGY